MTEMVCAGASPAADIGGIDPNLVVGDRTSIERANVEAVLRLFDDGWGANVGWEDVWRTQVASDVRTCFHSHVPLEGLDAAIAFNRELFTGFPTLQMTVENVTVEGNTVIVRGHLNGRQDGPFLGAPASGAVVDVPDVTLFRLEDGKIVESRYFTDLLAVMTAIGAVEMRG